MNKTPIKAISFRNTIRAIFVLIGAMIASTGCKPHGHDISPGSQQQLASWVESLTAEDIIKDLAFSNLRTNGFFSLPTLKEAASRHASIPFKDVVLVGAPLSMPPSGPSRYMAMGIGLEHDGKLYVILFKESTRAREFIRVKNLSEQVLIFEGFATNPPRDSKDVGRLVTFDSLPNSEIVNARFVD